MAEGSTPGDFRPLVVELEPGTYWWCGCGRSAHAPFCDGSHKGTGLQPVKYVVSHKQIVRWCQCKRTATPPECDGSHECAPT